jgi:hypothetical protein
MDRPGGGGDRAPGGLDRGLSIIAAVLALGRRELQPTPR